MNKLSFKLGLVFLTLLLGAFSVSALNLGTITVDLAKVAAGFNISDSNGTSNSLVIRVNVTSTANLAQINITNVSIRLLHQNATGGNTTNQAFLIGENINTSGYNLSTRSEFNFTFTSTNAPDGFRNYTIYVNETLHNSTLGTDGANSSNGGTVFNLTRDNTVPTVTLSAPANLTNQTGATATFSFSVTDAIGNLFQPSGNLSCQLQLYGNATNNLTLTNVTNQTTTAFTATTNLGQGIYSWFTNCTDTAGNVNSANIRNMIVIDSTRPRNANISFSLASVPYGDSVSITCSGSDNFNGASALIPGLNVSLFIQPAGLTSLAPLSQSYANNQTLVYSSTSELGVYNVNCTVMDGAGNQNSTSGTFEVVRKQGARAPPSVTSGAQKTVAKTFISSGSMADLGAIPTATATSRLMANGAIARLKINNEDHQITIRDIKDERVTLEIESTPQTLIMAKGDSKDVDLNADGNNDLKITLHGFDVKGRADLSFIALAQPGEEGYVPPVKEEPVTGPTPAAGSSTWIIILVLAIIVIVGYFLVKRK